MRYKRYKTPQSLINADIEMGAYEPDDVEDLTPEEIEEREDALAEMEIDNGLARAEERAETAWQIQQNAYEAMLNGRWTL
jgi:hypothetical protein